MLQNNDREKSSFPGKAILGIIALLVGFLILFSFQIPESEADFLDEDPDQDGYDGQFSEEGEEIYNTSEEYENGTNPNNKDSDGDGMWDGWELHWDFDPNDNTDAENDPDGDGNSNLQEFKDDTNPISKDMDQDGMPDEWEELNGLNTSRDDSQEDPDGDGLVNIEEFQFRTDPWDPDSDGDGMSDGWETSYFPTLDPTNPDDASPDSDNGGVNNIGEYYNDTNPQNGDDDYGEVGGGNGGNGFPEGNAVPPDTGRTDNELELINVFEPPLGRMKRVQILDGLATEYLLYLTNETKIKLEQGEGEYEHIHYGSLEVDFEAGTFTRLPSTTPDAEIVSHYFENGTVEFYRDQANGYYVYSVDGGKGVLHYTMGTNGTYFSSDVPGNPTVDDVPNGLLPIISNNVNDSVDWFIQNADDQGINNLANEKSLRKIINNLTTYFSGFSEGEGDVPEPTNGQDIYQAIAINKIGACRHRAFAFFVTANSLGLPTRYVANEAHAFVEVYVPDGEFSRSNWRRIDLGGTGSTEPGDPRPPSPEGNVNTIIKLHPIPEKLYMGEEFTITGNISDREGNNLSYYPFSVIVESKQIDSGSSDSMGNITINITLFDIGLGVNNLSLKALNHNGYIGNSSENRTFTLYSEIIFNTCMPWSSGKGTEIFSGGYITSANGTVLSGRNMVLSWDETVEDSNQTTQTGEFNLSYQIPGTETTGEHQISLNYPGSEYLLVGYFNRTINVTARKTVITAVVTPDEQDASGKVNISGTITDGSGNEVHDNGNLVIILHGEELVNRSLSTFTGANNKDFNADIKIPSTLNRGNYSLYVSFLPGSQETVPGASVVLRLFVDKITTEIYLHPREFTITETYTVNGSLISGSGGHVQGAIAIYWNGDFLKEVDVDNDGDFFYTDTTQGPPGIVNITAKYNGSSVYSETLAYVNFTIFSYTAITMNEEPKEGDIQRNNTIRISGELRDYQGENVPGMVLYLYANYGLVNQTVTDSNGYEINYHISADHQPGEIFLELIFRESGYYRHSYEYLAYYALGTTYINITNLTGSVLAGNNISVEGMFEDGMGHPLDFPITINWMNEKFTPILENGTFFWNKSIPISTNSSNYTLTVNFAGINDYEPSFALANITVYHETNLSVIIENITRGTLARFQGQLKDELGNGISGQEIDIYLRETYLATNTTNNQGVFYSYVPIPKNLTLGQANVTIRFNGTIFYTPIISNYTTGIYATSHISLVYRDYYERDSLFINGSLKDNLENPLDNTTVNLTFDNKYIDLQTNSTGNFSYLYTDDISLGIYLLNSEFHGKGYHLSTRRDQSYRIVSKIDISITKTTEALAGGRFEIAGTAVDDRDKGVSTGLNLMLQSESGNIQRTDIITFGQFETTWFLTGELEPGDYTLTLENLNPYPSSNYLVSNISMDIHVRRVTKIEMTIPDATREKYVFIRGNLTDILGNPLPHADLGFNIAGEFLEMETDENGEFEFPYLVPGDAPAGPNPTWCHYPGNDSFAPYNLTSLKINIYIPTHVELEGSHTHWSSIKIKGKVKDNNDVNIVLGWVDIYIEEEYIGTVSVGEEGFELTYSYPAVGKISIRAEYQRYNYYKSSERSVEFRLYANINFDYRIESPITDNQELDPGIMNPVLAGESFNFTLNITSDLGITPEIELKVLFRNTQHFCTVPDFFETFNVPTALVPEIDYNLSLTQLEELVNFKLTENPTYIPITVIQPTSIHVSDVQASGILYLNVTIRDSHYRIVRTGELNVTSYGTQVIFKRKDNGYAYSKNVSSTMGSRNYTFYYPTNTYYLSSNENITVFIKGITKLELTVPDSVRYNKEFKGLVKLTLANGQPVEEAVIHLRMNGDKMTIITDQNGMESFQGVMDSNHSISVYTDYNGDYQHYSSSDSESINLEKKEESWFSRNNVFSGPLIFLYGVIAAAGIYFWRRKQFKYLVTRLHDTTQRLQDAKDPKHLIIIAYNLMARHLRRFRFIRRRDETVTEFKDTTQGNLDLSDDGIGTLTSLVEIADYGDIKANNEHKNGAVQGLRNVEMELAGKSSGKRRGKAP